MLDAQIVVLAKQPLAGRTKTRLCPPLRPDQAAAVARASLLDTLDVVRRVPVRHRFVVLDGSPHGLVPPGFSVLPQRGDGLAERLAHAYDDVWSRHPAPTLLIGMDSPQVTPALLTMAVTSLVAARAGVIGLAPDGGWWALGLPAPVPGLFAGVPMSAADTGASQLERLATAGLVPQRLPVLRDIDVMADLLAVAAELPVTTRVARLAQQLRGLAAAS